MPPRTFDGTLPDNVGDVPDTTYASRAVDVPDEKPETSSLDALLSMVREREAEEVKLIGVPIPGLGVRLMCSVDVTYADWKDWQIKSVPPAKRKKPSPMDIDQRVLATFALVNTCQHVEIEKANGEWEPITGAGGMYLAFGGDEMLRKFNQQTPAALVEKLFGGNDGHIIRAGMRVINASGYGDAADEKEALEGDNPLE